VAVGAGEISGIVTPRVEILVERSARREELLSFPNWPQPRRIECITLEDGHLLWGLTLRLLDAVVPRLLAGEWAI
jgi:hypothetical protein